MRWHRLLGVVALKFQNIFMSLTFLNLEIILRKIQLSINYTLFDVYMLNKKMEEEKFDLVTIYVVRTVFAM